MTNANLNTADLNSVHLNNGEDEVSSFFTEMRRKRDSKPIIKVEFIETDNTTTDISAYYLSGANLEQIKERAPDEIQAGNFDIVLANHDNNFSEYVSGSLLNGIQYHGARIKVYVGFKLPNGTTVYEVQTEGIIDQLINTDESTAIFRCRDRIGYILDATLHQRPSGETPVFNSANGGNGTITSIDTKPFATVTENWTLTCTTGGGSGTALFSVVGSVSGSVGPATDGTEFQTNTGGVKFTIRAGTIDWSIGDAITFTTSKYPEWTSENLGKIIWAIFTGYNWDTDTQETWSSFVLGLDHTKSDSNTDLDYDAFVDAIDNLDVIGDVKGYIPYGSAAKNVLEDLLLLFLGSIFTGRDGRIKLKENLPTFGSTSVEAFSDTKKISNLSYTRSIDEVINYVTAHFKRTDIWQFSDEDINYDGLIVSSDSTSITNYKRVIQKEFSTLWFQTNGSHVESIVERLIGRYAEPPLNIDFVTGLDAVLKEIGDIISITDDKYDLSAEQAEIARVSKMFDDDVTKKISIRARRDADFTQQFGFWGSSENESDGISPQNADWDSASDSDKRFAYLSQTGGGGPDYRMF